MVVYDASPTWAMMPIHDNVKRAINYRSVTPMFFGLGGGALTGNPKSRPSICMKTTCWCR